MPSTDEMSFLEHLEELRWRILKSLAAIGLFAVVAFINVDRLITLLTAPIRHLEKPIILQALKVSDIFIMQIMVSITAGLVLASPVAFYQIWRFVEPALGKNAKRITSLVVGASSLFFLTGVAFAYFVIIPFSLNFFSALGGDTVESNYSISAYLGYIIWILLGAGLIFQLPVISLLLTRIGLLTPAFLRHYRAYALVIILILAAVLTPPDPLSQIMMSVPLVLLYELAILISKVFMPDS